jgi:hypothetical protein
MENQRSGRNSMENLFKEMEKRVKRYVKHWKEDFNYDKDIIKKVLDPNCTEIKYERYMYWICRECGTEIGYKGRVSSSYQYEYYMEDKANKYYELDLEEMTIKAIRNREKYRNGEK